MEKQIFTDPMVKPDNAALEDALGKNYKLHKEFTEIIAQKNLVPEWNYYNDGKSWLCKILNKKKNLCWLSVWNTGFKLTIFFTEKTIDGFYALDISNDIKMSAKEAKPTGKLIPVVIPVKNKKIMLGGLKILEYKMTLK